MTEFLHKAWGIIWWKDPSKFRFILFFSSGRIKLLLSHWLIALYIRANVFLACGCLFLKQLAEGALQLWPGSCCRPEHCLLRRLTRRWHESQPSNTFSSACFVLRLGWGKMNARLLLPPPSIFPSCGQTAKVNFFRASFVSWRYFNVSESH